MSVHAPTPPQPFYFICSFWGAEFREYFLRLSVASLLAPGNAPALSNRIASRLLVCTTKEDWMAIQEDPTFRQLALCITPEFIELRRSVPEFLRPHIAERAKRRGDPVPGQEKPWNQITITPSDCISPSAYGELQAIGRDIGQPLVTSHHYGLRIFFMSNGHRQGAERAFQDGASAVFLGPDLVLADGAIKELEAALERGARVVLAATLRFDQDKCLAAFRAMGQMAAGRPLTLPPREMVETVFPNMHPETACFEFDSPYFCDVATSSLWRVPGDAGVVLHFLNFYPLLVNFANVKRHRAEYLDEGGTIDGRYISLHFDIGRDIEVIDDSDRLMLASFTRSSEYYYRVSAGFFKRLPGFARRYKIHLLRRTMWSPMGDPIKRHFYVKPIRFHSRPLTPRWQEIERRSVAVAAAAVAPFDIFDHGSNSVVEAFGALKRAVLAAPQSAIRLARSPLRLLFVVAAALPASWRKQLKQLMYSLGVNAPPTTPRKTGES